MRSTPRPLRREHDRAPARDGCEDRQERPNAAAATGSFRAPRTPRRSLRDRRSRALRSRSYRGVLRAMALTGALQGRPRIAPSGAVWETATSRTVADVAWRMATANASAAAAIATGRPRRPAFGHRQPTPKRDRPSHEHGPRQDDSRTVHRKVHEIVHRHHGNRSRQIRPIAATGREPDATARTHPPGSPRNPPGQARPTTPAAAEWAKRGRFPTANGTVCATCPKPPNPTPAAGEVDHTHTAVRQLSRRKLTGSSSRTSPRATITTARTRTRTHDRHA